MTRSRTKKRRINRILGIALPLCAVAGTATAQQDEWEWEPGEGYHREEWYDPGDWFNDDDRIDYEYDWDDLDYEYDTRYDDEAWGQDFGWYYAWDPVDDTWDRRYGWHDARYEYQSDDYGWHYEWDPIANRWDYEYGWDDSSVEPDYGWYHVWNDETESWERAYGWHDSEFRYTTSDQNGSSSSTASTHGANRSSESERSESKGSRDRVAFAGRVESFKRTHLKGQKDEHTLVRLRMKDTSKRIVDLGPRVDLSTLDLEPGDRVSVEGRKGTISGQNVLMASTVHVDGDVTHVGGLSHGKGGRATLQGRIDGFKRVDLPEGPDDHLLLRVTLEDGTQRVIDMGPTTRMSQLDLQNGQQIMVEGPKRQYEGRTIVRAEKLRLGGERVALGKKGEKTKPHESNGSGNGERSSKLSGRLAGFQKVDMKDEHGAHLFVKLELRDGTKRVVDMGPSVRMDELDLEQGEQVMVSGCKKKIGDRTVLVAEELDLAGDRFRLERGESETY